MTKMRICRDEWWPVYALEDADGYGEDIEISDVLLEQYRHASAAYNKVQQQLHELYEEATA